MSIHRSLSVKGKLVRQRNVFTRAERLEILKKAGKYKDGDPVFGLPKVTTAVKVKKAKAKKEAAEGAAPAAGAPGAAAPAADAAKAAAKPDAAKGKAGDKKK